MKHITLSIILMLSTLICHAQIPAPNQTDTLIITSVKYNYADIDRENWPCDVIYKSMKDIRIGEQTFNIVRVDKYWEVITFDVFDKNDSTKKEYKLAFREKNNGEYVLTFSGYEFSCHKKGTLKEEKESSQGNRSYSGPSIKSYELNGRKASHLVIPAYRCYSEGEVTVIISVNPAGMVVSAEVKDDISETDECIRTYALRAARLSRFTASSNAASNEPGEIVYTFGSNAGKPNHAKLGDWTVMGVLPTPDVQSDKKGTITNIFN